MRTTPALVAALAVVALGGASAATATDADTTSAASAPSQTIEFEPCGPGNECAVVQAPLDYADPDGATVDLHVTRHPANGERLGALFVNPGGPGYGVEDMVHGFSQFGPPQVNDRFDLVGIDPRGTGKSGFVDCNTNIEQDKAFQLTLDDGLADDVDSYIDDFAELAATCEAEHGVEYLASLTTENVARDMEFVRQLLGDEPISYLGQSYGTAIGWVYASLFPESVRSMILDAAIVPDPTPNDLETGALAFEQALQRLDTSCQLWDECPVADQGLLNAIDALQEQLAIEGSIGPLQPYQLDGAVRGLGAIPFLVRDLAPALAMALDGDPAMLADIGGSFFTPLPGGSLIEFGASNPAIMCADGNPLVARTADQLLDEAERTLALAPNAGPSPGLPCDLWPVQGTGIPLPDYTGTAPIVVVGSRYDAITPYEWSVELADALGPRATLLTWEGSDHTAAFTGADRCIDDYLLTLLIDGQAPAPDTTCAQRGFVGLQWPDEGEAIVGGVTPGGSADQAGLEVGDIILEADGQPVETGSDVPEGAIGSTLELKVQRGDEILDVVMERGAPVWELWRESE